MIFLHPPIWFALILAVAVASIGWVGRWLSRDGAIAAAVVGFVIYWLGGAEAIVPLLAFFVSSSLLSKLPVNPAVGKLRSSDRDSVRTAAQVAANGGAAALLVMAHRLLAYQLSVETNRVVQIMFLATVAAVNADTWATEIGKRWGGTPRLLNNWQRATPGSSGAISLVGTIGAALGAVFIPFCVYKFWGLTGAEFVSVAWAALLGSLFDSILGAGVQGVFRNTVTGELTEEPIKGARYTLVRGLSWVDNNAVNFAAGLVGAGFCWVLLHYGLRNVF